jgi:chorismate mutase
VSVLDAIKNQLRGAEAPPSPAAAAQRPTPKVAEDVGLPSMRALIKAANAVGDPARFHGREALPPGLEDADITTGAPAALRAQMRTKVTDAGRLNFLRETFGQDENGKDNFFVDNDHGVFIKTKGPNGKIEWRLVNPAGPDRGDVAEAVPDVVQAATGAIGGAIGAAAGPVGVAAGSAVGDAVGSVARQAISAALPGSDELTPLERAGRVGVDVAAGLVSEGIARGGAKVFDKIRPQNLRAKALGGGIETPQTSKAAAEAVAATKQATPPRDIPGAPTQVQTPASSQNHFDEQMTAANVAASKARPEYFAEGKTLAKQTGVDLSPAQITGSRDALRYEGMIAQSPGVADKMADLSIRRAAQLQDAFKRELRTIAETPGAERAGEMVAQVATKHRTQLVNMRSRVAQRMFDDARKKAGDGQIIPAQETLATIRELEETFRPFVGTDTADIATRRLAEERKKIIAKFAEDYKEQSGKELTDEEAEKQVMATVSEFSRSLSIFSKASAGTGKFAKDLDDATNQYIAKRIYSALQKDLGSVADTMPGASELRAAREAFAKLSAPIEQTKKDAFSTIIKDVEGGAPDKAIARMSKWSPVQLRDAMVTLSKTDPQASLQVKSQLLEEVFSKARGGHELANRGVDISPAKFASAWRSDHDRIKAIFADDAAGYLKFRRLAKVATRLADNAGVGPGGSQTASLMWLRELPKTVAGALVDPREVAVQVASIFSAKSFASAIANPKTRDAMLELVSTRGTTKAGVSAINRLLLQGKLNDAMDTEKEDE